MRNQTTREGAEDRVAAIEANKEEEGMKTVIEAANASAKNIASVKERVLSAASSTVSDVTGGTTSYFFAPTASSWSTPTFTWTITPNLVAAADDEDERTKWEGILALEGQPTSDGRYLMPGEIAHRELPIPLLAQSATAMGHDGAEICGRIESISFIPIAEFDRREEYNLDDVRDETVVIWAEGTFDTSEHGDEAQRLIDNGAGVSVDLTVTAVYILDPETFEEVPDEEIDFEKLFFGEYVFGYAAKIAGTTIVAIPAFEEAEVDEVDEVEDEAAVVASAVAPLAANDVSIFMPKERRLLMNTSYGFGLAEKRLAEALTAAAAGEAPVKPPLDWFSMPEANQPTPLTVTADGRVFGHLALWNQCHTGFAFCQRPPRSTTGYSHFHVGQIETAEGELINVGRVTVGEAGRAKGGHASIVLGRQGAMDHYDKTGCVGAFVRASNGTHGIWLSGAVRSDVPAERIRDMRANPPSGDWRDGELVAVLSVPVPGFPIPRAEARLVASGAEEDIPVLIATGYSPESDEVMEEQEIDLVTFRKRMRKLHAQATLTLAVSRGDALPIESEEGEVVGYSFPNPSPELAAAAEDALTSEAEEEDLATITLEPEKKRVYRKAKA